MGFNFLMIYNKLRFNDYNPKAVNTAKALFLNNVLNIIFNFAFSFSAFAVRHKVIEIVS